MIQFSTLMSGLYPAEELRIESPDTLSAEDENFYTSIRPKLDEALRDPQAESIKKIMEYSSRFRE